MEELGYPALKLNTNVFEQESAVKTGRDGGGEGEGWDLTVC